MDQPTQELHICTIGFRASGHRCSVCSDAAAPPRVVDLDRGEGLWPDRALLLSAGDEIAAYPNAAHKLPSPISSRAPANAR